MYLRVWEYAVAPGEVEAFVADYGPTGTWARLFQTADGYYGTDLYRDVHAPDRFLTVDSWRTERDWTAFRERGDGAYERLGRSLTHRTLARRELLAGQQPLRP